MSRALIILVMPAVLALGFLLDTSSYATRGTRLNLLLLQLRGGAVTIEDAPLNYIGELLIAAFARFIGC